MNKQLVAFLSLFSLVLVLSVYYVLIPSANSNEIIEPESNQPVSGTIMDAESAYFESLDIQRESVFKQYYDEQNEILASSSYTNKEKEQALIMIEEYKKQEEMLVQLERCIEDIGYQNVFVEYINQDIHVVTSCMSEENQVIEAAQIIFTIQDLLDREENIFVEFPS